jgi:hypothetical protein
LLHANHFHAKLAGFSDGLRHWRADQSGWCVCVDAQRIPFRRSKLGIDARFQNMSTIGKSAWLLFSKNGDEKMGGPKTLAMLAMLLFDKA